MGYAYDFNVVCCNNSQEGENFTETITRFFEQNGLKGYYAERDLLPGRNVINEFYEVIRHSKYTILVIDKEFVRQPWPSYLGQSTMRYFADSTNMKNIDRLIVIYIGLTEDYFKQKFPEFNMKQSVYFPSSSIQECDENVLERLALALHGFMDIHDALAEPFSQPVQSQQDKQATGTSEVQPNTGSYNGKTDTTPWVQHNNRHTNKADTSITTTMSDELSLLSQLAMEPTESHEKTPKEDVWLVEPLDLPDGGLIKHMPEFSGSSHNNVIQKGRQWQPSGSLEQSTLF